MSEDSTLRREAYPNPELGSPEFPIVFKPTKLESLCDKYSRKEDPQQILDRIERKTNKNGEIDPSFALMWDKWRDKLEAIHNAEVLLLLGNEGIGDRPYQLLQANWLAQSLGNEVIYFDPYLASTEDMSFYKPGTERLHIVGGKVSDLVQHIDLLSSKPEAVVVLNLSPYTLHSHMYSNQIHETRRGYQWLGDYHPHSKGSLTQHWRNLAMEPDKNSQLDELARLVQRPLDPKIQYAPHLLAEIFHRGVNLFGLDPKVALNNLPFRRYTRESIPKFDVVMFYTAEADGNKNLFWLVEPVLEHLLKEELRVAVVQPPESELPIYNAELKKKIEIIMENDKNTLLHTVFTSARTVISPDSGLGSHCLTWLNEMCDQEERLRQLVLFGLRSQFNINTYRPHNGTSWVCAGSASDHSPELVAQYCQE